MAEPANTVIEVGLEGTLFGQRIINVLHYAVFNPSTTVNYADELEQLAMVFSDVGIGGFGSGYLGCMPTSFNWDFTRCQSIYPIRKRVIRIGVGEPGRFNTTTTANVSASITKRTVFAGRSQIGGIRLVLPTTESLQGKITIAARANLDLFANQLDVRVLEPTGGGTYDPVIYHRKAGVVPKFDKVTDCVPETTTRVMRRRTVGLGV